MNSDEIRNISNRPQKLYEIPYYKNLPDLPIQIDIAGVTGGFLNADILDLCGVQPMEEAHLDTYGKFITMNPSKGSLELYKQRGDSFQGVQVIINAYGFRENDGVIQGKPYNISIFPMSKRGELSVISTEFIEKIDLEDLDKVPKHYRGFNPFLGAYGFYVFNHTDYTGIESDMIGFVQNIYFLSDKFNFHHIVSPIMPLIDTSTQVKNDYKRYRKDWYFKKFTKIKPRKIWGCDSPIELFLLQAMDSLDLTPEIQTIITNDGLTFPSLHKLWENARSRKRLNMITEADFYFPEEKLAIFCDSKQHHASQESIDKDKRIDSELSVLGIKSLRVLGTDIVSDPIACAEKIKEFLGKT